MSDETSLDPPSPSPVPVKVFVDGSEALAAAIESTEQKKPQTDPEPPKPKPKRVRAKKAPKAPAERTGEDAPRHAEHEVQPLDPRFFGALNLTLKKLVADERKQKLSSFAIV